MRDREPTKPGRVLITPENGTVPFHATITRADDPTDPGTPYNKATQLSDKAAAMLGFNPTDDPTVNDAFMRLAKGGGSGSILAITFDPEFAGHTFTVSDGSDTVTGTVPAELVASVNVINIGSTYTIKSEVNGRECSTAVTTGPYFGRYTAVLKYANVYGVRWSGGPETIWSRTDDAEGFLDPDPFVNDGSHSGRSPFDGLTPWAGMQIVDDPVLGKLVSIPKYWYKWTKSGAVMTLQISNMAQPGFFVSPAHADRGDGQGERDVVYVGRYKCNSNYKSMSGALPKTSMTRDAARKGIAALDPSAWQYDFAMYWTIMMLYLVEFADWDVQKTIGYGCGNGSAVQACGASDKMPYHTGTMQKSRDAYGVGCQYRYIEGLWDNCFDFVDGIYSNSANIYCIKNPGSFSDSEGGTLIAEGLTPGNGYIKAWGIPAASGFEWALYPSEVGGSESTYVPDIFILATDRTIFGVGGSYYQGQEGGIFRLYNVNADHSNSDWGCRLMKLPNKEED